MSLKPYYQPVPFKITVWEGARDIATGFHFLDEHNAWFGKIDNESHELRIFRYEGWTAVFGDVYESLMEYYEYKFLVQPFVKNGKKVYSINEDKVGSERVETFFCDDRETLEEFCRDVDFPVDKIEKDACVVQKM